MPAGPRAEADVIDRSIATANMRLPEYARVRRWALVPAPFAADTDYWPAAKQAMVNFTVADLDAMREQLREAGVEVDERVEELEGIGRFGWAVDPEGNRFELWEPVASR